MNEDNSENSEWLRVTLASIGDGVICTDRACRITYMNAVAEALTGWMQADALAQPLSNVFRIVNADSRQAVPNPARAALEKEVAVDLAARSVLIARDGAEHPVDDSTSPIRDDAGEILGVVLVFREVTHRRRAEQELRQAKAELEHRVAARTRELAQSNQFLSTLLENTHEGILACDALGQFTMCNSAAREYLGLSDTTTSLSTLKYRQIWHADDARNIPEHQLPLARALRGVVVKDVELLVRVDGQFTRALITAAQPIWDCHGEVVGAVMSVHDATGRKHAEHALQIAHDELEARVVMRTEELTKVNAALLIEAAQRARAEQEREAAYARVAATMDSITEAFLAVDCEWRFTYVNTRAERMVGRQRDQLIGCELWQVFPELVGTVFERDYRRAMEEGISFQVESCFERSEACFLVNLFPVEGGGLSFYFQDITERRRNEAAAREHELRFRTIVEQVKDYAIFATDIHGRPTSWNEGVRRVLGFEEVEFIARDVAPIIFTPEDYFCGIAEQELEQAAATGSAGNDRWMRKKDGTRFFANGVTTGSRDERGQLLGFMKVMRDQTERKEMEDELRRIAEDLADADHRKNEFLAMLAHELRNPLAPISNALRLLQTTPNDAEVVLSSCEVMGRQIRHMVRLVDDLLDVSRITRGKIDLRKSVVELSSVIHQAIETSRPAIESAGQELAIVLPSAPIHVHGDAVRLAQVFSNLLNNACKYSDPGGHIRVSAWCQGSQVVVAIKDDGVGIPPSMLPKVFEIFTQVDQTLERSQGGLGIGLTLVQRLVRLHDGSVDAYSDGPGKGSEFVVRLPLTTLAPDRAPTATTPSALTQRRVLVVDDNRDSASTLALLLHIKGNETCTVHDGIDAIEAAERFRPEVVLLDIGLPRLNGYEVAQHIREQPWGQEIILVALTGWGQEEDRRKSEAAGFDAHLVKPLDHVALNNLMNELLS